MPNTHATAVASAADPAEYGLVLDVLSAQIGATAAHIEDSVTRVCGSFASIARRTKESAAHAAGGAGDAGALATAQATIAALLGRMDQVQRAAEESVETLRRIEAISDRVNRIQRSLEEVDLVAHTLKMLALNARIEAARAGAHGRAFGVVASETGDLATAVRATAKSVRGMVESLWTEVQDSTKRMRAGLIMDQSADEIRRAADQSREEGARALESLTRANADMQALVAEAAANSARLADDINEAMTALQFQDSVSQQLEHVRAALDEAGDGLAGDGGDATDLLDRLRARATMDSERQVLDRLTNRSPSAAGSAPNSIELF